MVKTCPTCGREGDSKFCPECGVGMVEQKGTSDDTKVILCDGKNEDGRTCGQVLQKSYKFCMTCAKPVDKNRFETTSENSQCQNCDASLTSGENICQACVLKQKKSVTQGNCLKITHYNDTVKPVQTGP